MKGSLIVRIRQVLAAAKGLLRRRRARGLLPRPGGPGVGSAVSRILSDAIQLNETAGAADRAARRTDFIVGKLTEFGYTDPRIDEQGTISVSIATREPAGQAVLLFADAGFPAEAGADCLVALEGDTARGRGLAENSVGAAALLALAERLAAEPAGRDRDLILAFTAVTSDTGDTEALRALLQAWAGRLGAAINVRSLTLGRLAERPMGACRLRVRARTQGRDVETARGAASAISALAAIAARLGSIRWDSADTTFLHIARLEAGTGFGWHAADGIMEIEIFSTDAGALEVARNAVQATIEKTSEENAAVAEIEVAATHPVAAPEISADLNEILRRVYARLRIRPTTVWIPDQAALVNSHGVPAVSIGITTGKKSLTEESVDIPVIETGFRQLLALLDECARVLPEAER